MYTVIHVLEQSFTNRGPTKSKPVTLNTAAYLILSAGRTTVSALKGLAAHLVNTTHFEMTLLIAFLFEKSENSLLSVSCEH